MGPLESRHHNSPPAMQTTVSKTAVVMAKKRRIGCLRLTKGLGFDDWNEDQDLPEPERIGDPRSGVTPYEARGVLPHERTHAGPKEGRLRLLRATHTQLEPIFLLYDADPVFERPPGDPARMATELT